MSVFAIYDRATGRITAHYRGTPKQLAVNVRPGLSAIPGEYDPQSQRIDDATGQVVDWQPPQPSDDHEWNQAKRRWWKRMDVIMREDRRREAQHRVDRLERSQHRAIREQVLGKPGATERLQAIDDEIEVLRKDLT